MSQEQEMQKVLNELASNSLEQNARILDDLQNMVNDPAISQSLAEAKDELSKQISQGKKSLEEVLQQGANQEFFENNPLLFQVLQQIQLVGQVAQMQEIVKNSNYQAKDTSFMGKVLDYNLKQQLELQKQQIAQNIQNKRSLEFREKALKIKDISKISKLEKDLVKNLDKEIREATKSIEEQYANLKINEKDLAFETLKHNVQAINQEQREDFLISSGNYLKYLTIKDLYRQAIVKTTAEIERETPQTQEEMKKIKYKNLVHTFYGYEAAQLEMSDLEKIVDSTFESDQGLETDYSGRINYSVNSSILELKQKLKLIELIDGIDYKLEDINELGDEQIILMANQSKAIEDERKRALVIDSIYNSFLFNLDPEKREKLQLKNQLSRHEYTGKSRQTLEREFEKNPSEFMSKYESDEIVALQNTLNIDDKYSIIDNVKDDIKNKKHFRHTHLDNLPNRNIKTGEIKWDDNKNILKIIQVSDIHLFTDYFLTQKQLEDIRTNGTDKSFSEIANKSKIRDWILSDLSNLIDSYYDKNIEVDLLSFNGDFIEAGLKQKVLMEMMNYEIAKRGGDHTNQKFTKESVEFETALQNYFSIEQKMQQLFMREFGFSKFDLTETSNLLDKINAGTITSQYEHNYAQNLTKIIQDYELQDTENPKRSLFIREQMMKGNTEGLFGKFEVDLKKLQFLKGQLGGFLQEYESIMEDMSRDIAKQIDKVAKDMQEKYGILSLYQLGNHDDSFMCDHLQHGINLATEPIYVHHKNGRKIKIRGSVNCDGATTVGQRAGNHLAFKGRQYDILSQIKKHHPELLEAMEKAKTEQERKAVYAQMHDWIGYHGFDLEFHRLKGTYSTKDKDTVDIEIHHNPVNLGHTNPGKQFGLDFDTKTSSYATLAAVEQLINHSTRDNNTDKIILAGHTHGSQARVDTINGSKMTTYVTTAENPMLIGVDMRNGKSKHYNINTQDELYNPLNSFKDDRLDRFNKNSSVNLDKVNTNKYESAGYKSKSSFEADLEKKSATNYSKPSDPAKAQKAMDERARILDEFEKRNEEQMANYAKFNDKERKIKLERDEKYYN